MILPSLLGLHEKMVEVLTNPIEGAVCGHEQPEGVARVRRCARCVADELLPIISAHYAEYDKDVSAAMTSHLSVIRLLRQKIQDLRNTGWEF